jgi:predicted DsbA family dithiol-disulfide isomerase
MPPGGQDVFEHLTQKYGKTVDQVRATQNDIKARAAAVGYPFHPEGRKHVYNTFNAHRLLHWAGLEHGPQAQHRLKRELLVTYFQLAVDLDDPQNVLAAVSRAGLDVERASEILASDEFAAEVRAQQRKYTSMGIQSVPSIIINDKYLLQGAQPAEAFEQALRQVAAESENN